MKGLDKARILWEVVGDLGGPGKPCEVLGGFEEAYRMRRMVGGCWA